MGREGKSGGLFFDPAVGRMPEVTFCEGPTDTAAAISTSNHASLNEAPATAYPGGFR